MQLKASWLLAVAAANGGQALVVNRAGTLFMSPADNEAANGPSSRTRTTTWGLPAAHIRIVSTEMLCTSDGEAGVLYSS